MSAMQIPHVSSGTSHFQMATGVQAVSAGQGDSAGPARFSSPVGSTREATAARHGLHWAALSTPQAHAHLIVTEKPESAICGPRVRCACSFSASGMLVPSEISEATFSAMVASQAAREATWRRACSVSLSPGQCAVQSVHSSGCSLGGHGTGRAAAAAQGQLGQGMSGESENFKARGPTVLCLELGWRPGPTRRCLWRSMSLKPRQE